MDYREKSFKDKFVNAARELGTKPNQVISIKIRENVNSNSEYQNLLDALQHEINGDVHKIMN